MIGHNIGYSPVLTDLQIVRLKYRLDIFGNKGKYHTEAGQKFIEDILKGGDYEKLRREIRPPREVAKEVRDILKDKG
jgi:Zn-dependent oligopeptidase